MFRAFVFAALVALSACGNSESVMDQIERREAEEARLAEASLARAEAFMAEQRGKPGVTAQPSGIVYEVAARSPDQSLARPDAESLVLVHYQGALQDGTVFDSSIQRGQPAEFRVGEVVPGFAEALTLMRPGDTFIVTIPPELGYGQRGAPPDIPGNSALVFRIQLLAFRTADGRVVSAPRAGQ